MYSSAEDVHKLLQSSTIVSMGPAFHGKLSKIRKPPRARTAPSRADNSSDPSKFLRKNQRSRVAPSLDRSEYACSLVAPRPPVPKSITPRVEKSRKNFVKENVKFVESMQARKPKPRIVVSCRGELQDLTPFLEGRQMIASRNFGKLPKYLVARKKAWEKEIEQLEEVSTSEQDECPIPGYSQVPEEERQRLLQGLKERWMELNKEFQILPMLCDTIPKIKRKLSLEKEISQIEKDMDLLERNPFIYLEKRRNPHA